MRDTPGWYEDAVVYSLDPKTFADGDGDGVGDLAGLVDRLDYLSRLGVDCLWLLPIFPTPNRDNGYDVADYYGVDSRYGTLGEFVEFVEAAEARGMKVLLDMVVNHTSDQHRWFQQAREDPDSKFREYYVWSDDPPDRNRTLVFPGEEDSVWSYDEVAESYYYHRFYHFQPDLNLANPDVREEIRQILSFWTQLGVAGFRIDAATLMIDEKGEGLVPERPHDVFREMKAAVRSRRPDGVLLAEADDEPEKLGEYFGDGDEMDLGLNFVLNAHLVHALASGDAGTLEAGLERLPALPDHGRWANFLRNFDELNLGRLSETSKREVYSVFAPEEDMRIYGRGLRRRLAPMLGGDRDRIEMAFSLLFSLPGTPIVVAGDEIGMGEDLSRPGRNAVRTPMHWSGVGTGPAIDEGPFASEHVNVADQMPDPDSLLNRVRRIVAEYHGCRAVRRGDHAVVKAGPDSVFVQRHEAGAVVFTAHNLVDEPATVALPAGGTNREPTLRTGEADVSVSDDRVELAMSGYGYCWLAPDGIP